MGKDIEDSFEQEEPLLEEHADKVRTPTRPTWRKSIFWLVHGVLLLSNVIWSGTLFLRSQHAANKGNIGPPANYEDRNFDLGYGGHYLGQKENKTHRILFAGPPTPTMDEEWNKLYQDPQLIRLSGDERVLLRSDSVKLDDGSGYLGALDVFHQLHCLDMIRKSLHPEYYYATETHDRHVDHIGHCLNYMRQKTICDADTTMLSFENQAYSGPDSERYRAKFTATRSCKSFDDVYAWAMERRVARPEENQLLQYGSQQEEEES